MKILEIIGMFLFIFFLFYFVAIITFPTDDANVLQAPDWYIILTVGVSFGGTWLYSTLKKRKGKDSRQQIKYDSSLSSVSPQPLRIASSALSEYDELLDQAAMIVFETNQASVSIFQRRLKLGYARAARLLDQLEEIGVVGPFAGSAPRTILITKQQYLLMRQKNSIPAISKNQVKISVDELIRNEEVWRHQQYESELDYIDHMDGRQFEDWCADLLQRNGFTNVEITSGSGDQGVDITAKKDGIKYAIQCKCYSSDLSNKPVQEVNTGKAIYHCQVGAVMTNRYFTAGAKKVAEATGILLWDRNRLIDMLK